MRRVLMGAAAALAVVVLCGCASGSAHDAAPSRAQVKETPLSSPSPTLGADSTEAPLPAAEADIAAAKILDTETAKFSKVVADGVTASAGGTTNDATVKWWRDEVGGSTTPMESDIMATFQRADALFTASDEPTTPITDWRDSPLPGDLMSWYLGTPSMANATQIQADVAKMAADATAVRAGTK